MQTLLLYEGTVCRFANTAIQDLGLCRVDSNTVNVVRMGLIRRRIKLYILYLR